jgi:hydroxymethylglutaryl-CoA lyase
VTAVRLRDVTLRDGLQDEVVVPTTDKVAVFEALVRAGVRDLELTSFVRPDRVPAMADAAELAAATAPMADGVERWALALNQRGAQRAVEAGLHHLQFVVSVSEPHSLGNAGRTPEAALAELEAIVAGLPAGIAVEVTLATAFGCPYLGPVPAGEVLTAAERALAAGASGISLADTIGTAIPSEVTALVTAATTLAGDRPVGVHLHDTRGLGIANALAALDAGASRLDGTVGGLGGCPFAPGASGNLALEDLVHVLEASGIDTGIDLDALIEVAHVACSLVGRAVESHVGKAGPRFQQLAERTA